MLILNDNNEVGIDAAGYVCPEDTTSPIWECFIDDFSLLQEINIYMYGLFDKMNANQNDVIECFLAETYNKIYKDYQSGLLLASRGLIEQSKVMLRVILDKIMIMQAVHNDNENYHLWFKHQIYQRNRLIKDIKNKRPGLEHLYDKVNGMDLEPDAKRVSSLEWARLSAMESEYNITYRLFSGSVHYSLSAYEEDITFSDGRPEAIMIGPQTDEIEILLITLATDALKAASIIIEHYGLKDEKYAQLENKLKTRQRELLKWAISND